ncbi:hypothetical protein KTE96_26180 [Burkholderia multivorans]|uniref:hypothetical protein n=1 Tax=Burkholderia multivorans TaxID=87883 RepID=UPI001C23431C|nr:hypothetical protein [Burkholderia multivorans]MBU9615228.1 hypothetical protein [Burkholderia multivorans]
MPNDAKQPDAPLRYVDITLSPTGDENHLVCAAIRRANKAGMLRDFAEHAGLGGVRQHLQQDGRRIGRTR